MQSNRRGPNFTLQHKTEPMEGTQGKRNPPDALAGKHNLRTDSIQRRHTYRLENTKLKRIEPGTGFLKKEQNPDRKES